MNKEWMWEVILHTDYKFKILHNRNVIADKWK